MALHPVRSEPTKAPPEPGAPRRPLPGDAKPAVKPGATAGAKPKGASVATIREIERWFLKTYIMVGTVLSPFKPALGNQVLVSAPKCAEAMSKLCAEDPRIRKAVTAMMVTSVYGTVIAAHLPIILVIAAEYRTTEDNARFNQQTLLGFASMLSDEGLAGMMFGGADDDEPSADAAE